jgi:hypothetical protein
MAETASKRRTLVAKQTGIYKSVSGNYEIAYRDSDGRQVFRTLSKGTKLAEAKSERAEIMAKLGRGEPVRSTRQTFGPFADEVIGAMNRRPRTIDNYKLHLRVHLNPRFESDASPTSPPPT